jgi:hypothetical protein
MYFHLKVVQRVYVPGASGTHALIHGNVIPQAKVSQYPKASSLSYPPCDNFQTTALYPRVCIHPEVGGKDGLREPG